MKILVLFLVLVPAPNVGSRREINALLFIYFSKARAEWQKPKAPGSCGAPAAKRSHGRTVAHRANAPTPPHRGAETNGWDQSSKAVPRYGQIAATLAPSWARTVRTDISCGGSRRDRGAGTFVVPDVNRQHLVNARTSAQNWGARRASETWHAECCGEGNTKNSHHRLNE